MASGAPGFPPTGFPTQVPPGIAAGAAAAAAPPSPRVTRRRAEAMTSPGPARYTPQQGETSETKEQRVITVFGEHADRLVTIGQALAVLTVQLRSVNDKIDAHESRLTTMDANLTANDQALKQQILDNDTSTKAILDGNDVSIKAILEQNDTEIKKKFQESSRALSNGFLIEFLFKNEEKAVGELQSIFVMKFQLNFHTKLKKKLQAFGKVVLLVDVQPQVLKKLKYILQYPKNLQLVQQSSHRQ